jgi:hypothetical protein
VVVSISRLAIIRLLNVALSQAPFFLEITLVIIFLFITAST